MKASDIGGAILIGLFAVRNWESIFPGAREFHFIGGCQGSIPIEHGL